MTTLLVLLLAWTQNSASIEGSVTRSGTGEAVPGARIVITKVGGGLSEARIAVTDADGQFNVGNLTVGNYRVFSEREGYVRAEYGQRGENRPGTAVVLLPGELKSNIAIAMTRSAVISGRVANSRGEPQRNVDVRLLKSRYDQGIRSMTTIQTTSTNDLGEYRIFGISPGRYFLSATPWPKPWIENDTYIVPDPAVNPAGGPVGQSMAALTGVLASGAAIDPAALIGDKESTVYFQGTGDPSAATIIDLREGEVFHASEIRLETAGRVRGVRISGVVVDGGDGKPAANPTVSLISLGIREPGGPSRTIFPSGGRTRDGTFSFDGVTPGSYAVAASRAVSPESGASEYKSLSLEVGISEVTDLRIALVPTVGVQGRFSLEGHPYDAELGRMRVRLQNILTQQVFQSAVRPDGTFTINAPASADYRLSLIQAPAKTYIQTIRLGETDVLNSGVHIESEVKGELVIGASTNTGKLDGIVLDKKQQPVTGATVVLVPAHARRQQYDLYRSGATDTEGRVQIDGVVPGDYSIFAWDDIEINAWQDPEIIRLYEDRGEPVRVEAGSSQSLALRIIESP